MVKTCYTAIFYFVLMLIHSGQAETCTHNESGYKCTNIVAFPKLPAEEDNIYCEDCKITSFTKDTYPHENTIRRFNLTNGQLERIETRAFLLFKELQFLDLSTNKISNIAPDAFIGLTLKELHLKNNFLRSLPPLFANKTQIEILDVSDNQLTAITKDTFQGAFNIFDLNLERNDISSIDAEAFRELTSLTSLNLDGNSLCFIPSGTFRDLTELQTLNLANNRFKALNIGAFTGLTGLRHFSIANNSLTHFDEGVLLQFDNLNSLDISGNGIGNFYGYYAISYAPNLKTISIEDNVFDCSTLKNILQTFFEKKISVKNNVNRYDVLNIRAIACLNTLPYDQFKVLNLESFLAKVKTDLPSSNKYCDGLVNENIYG